jgi:hypothetical protein
MARNDKTAFRAQTACCSRSARRQSSPPPGASIFTRSIYPLLLNFLEVLA